MNSSPFQQLFLISGIAGILILLSVGFLGKTEIGLRLGVVTENFGFKAPFF